MAEGNETENFSKQDEDGVAMVTKELRKLTSVEVEKLEKDTKCVTDFKQQKLEKEAQKNWDLFYKRNTTKFFKDRHWTKREFSELVNQKADQNLVIFEIGCGVGNFMFPLLEEDNALFFYACDFSKRAVEFVQANPKYDAERCTAFQCDITSDDLSSHIRSACVDVATMIFVLSAINPDKMVIAMRNVFQVLKPGGCLLLRDYGLYDHAMLRFASGHKLSEHFYVRQDGTRAYYFTLRKLSEIMLAAGFTVHTCEYIQRQTVNKKEGLCVPRIFVQGKFMKPSPCTGNSLETDHCVGREDLPCGAQQTVSVSGDARNSRPILTDNNGTDIHSNFESNDDLEQSQCYSHTDMASCNKLVQDEVS